MRHHRSRLKIVAEILDIAKNGACKTRIMYLGNLSFSALEKYLNMLSACGLLQQRNDLDGSYVVTEKGQGFLDDYYELEKDSEIVDSKKRILERALTGP